MPREQEHRCSGRTYDGRMVRGWPCQETRGLVRRQDEWWCRHHDPVKKKQKQQTQSASWDQQQKTDARVEREGRRLAKQLGVQHAYCERFTGGGVARWHTRRVLCVSFEEVEKLLKRAGKPGAKHSKVLGS